MAARSTRTTKTPSLALMGANSFKKKQVKTDCRLCGKKGHKAVDCWENPKNADKRPKTWKTKAKETAAIGADHKSKTCTHCGKKGHTIDYCWKKKAEEKGKESAEMAFIHIEKESILLQGQKCVITKNTFIADTGATSHMRYSLAGMYDMHPHVTEITVGNSEVMLSKQRGKFKELVAQQDGS